MNKEYSHQLVTGITFGITSAVITSLGMIVGLHEATSSRQAVFAGIVVMAIADGMADAAGLHVVEEAEVENGVAKHDTKEVWMTTFFTFLGGCGFTLSFAVPILIFDLGFAVIVDIIWGILLLVAVNVYIAKVKNERAVRLIMGHVFLALSVITVSYFTGKLISGWVQ